MDRRVIIICVLTTVRRCHMSDGGKKLRKGCLTLTNYLKRCNTKKNVIDNRLTISLNQQRNFYLYYNIISNVVLLMCE